MDQAMVMGGEVHIRTIKLDFSAFNGEYPNGWMYKINQFFFLFPQHTTIAQIKVSFLPYES